eukprot:16708-Heterococcus_DN1.PRE.1
MLVLFGGYSDNTHFDDTWQFNITTARWRQRTHFGKLHVQLAEVCCRSTVLLSLRCVCHTRQSTMVTLWVVTWVAQNLIRTMFAGPQCTAHAQECIELQWAASLKRDTVAPWGILPYAQQEHYYPHKDGGTVGYGVMSHEERDKLIGQLPTPPADGTPLREMYSTQALAYQHQPTGKQQYARPFVYTPAGSSVSVTLYEHCTSVFGEPTRGTLLDGQFGRASSPVLIAQPRRKAAGWDGCRDRADGNTALPQRLMWQHPGHRSAAAAVYSASTGYLVLYGGRGHTHEVQATTDYTLHTEVLPELWVLGVHDCPSGCNGQGECNYGNCYCTPGYYGLDCSNSSCPGDYCYFDELSSEQVH